MSARPTCDHPGCSRKRAGGSGRRYCQLHSQERYRRVREKARKRRREPAGEREAREQREAREVQADQLTVLAIRIMKGLQGGW